MPGAKKSGSWKIGSAAAMRYRGKKNRALDPEEVPSWLISKKKMGMRAPLSEVEHELREALTIGLTHAELPHGPDTGSF